MGEERKLSRREFLRVAIGGVAGLLVGGAAGYFTGSTVTRKALEREIEELRGKAGLPAEKIVHIYNWSEYIHPYVLDLFKEEFEMETVVYDVYESNEELRAAMEAGKDKYYDVIFPSDSYIPEFVQKGWARELDFKKIPNFKFISEKFKDPPWDPGCKHSVPYMWGSTGIGWLSNRIEEGVTDWDALFDESYLKKYSKKITMLIEPADTFGAAFKYLGYNFYDEPGLPHIDEALELLKRQKPYILKYADATEYIPGLINEEFWISLAWSGDVYVAMEDNENIVYTIPESGTNIWVDCMCIPENAPHPDAAYAFINFMLRPEIMALNTEEVWYANPELEASQQLVSEEILEDPGIYPPEEIIEKCDLSRPYTAEELEILSEAWAELMAYIGVKVRRL